MRPKQVTQYEFSNLPITIGMGNVLRRVEHCLPRLGVVETTTVTDKKISVDVGNDGTIDWYVADITSATDSAKCYFETYTYKVQNLHWLMPISKSLKFDKSELLRIHNRYYYPFGSPMDGRTFSSDKYRFGFNGKENDNEVKGEGGQQDYGMRVYDPRLGRFLSVDPLTKKYPMLTPYQFSSNNPIWFIDLDGLEGVQYLLTTKMKDGTTVIKRIVEIDVYVATSKNVNSIYYKSADLQTIESNLEIEYNKGFKDASGNIVEFIFNVKEFDADEIAPAEKAKQLGKDPNNYVMAKNGSYMPKGCVLTLGELEENEQGKTNMNNITIDKDASDPSHTIAHEMAHVFMNYSNLNPKSEIEHDNAGGIFYYKGIDVNKKNIYPIRDLNQNNVNMMLKSLPEINSKTIEEQ